MNACEIHTVNVAYNLKSLASLFRNKIKTYSRIDIYGNYETLIIE